MKRKTISQSPIEMLVVSRAQTKREAEHDVFLYTILNALCKKRTNIALTILTNVDNLPKAIYKNKRITIIRMHSSWIHYGTVLFSLLPKHIDYCILTSGSLTPLCWWYAKLLRAKSVYLEGQTKRHIHPLVQKFLTWSIHHYDLTMRFPLKSTRRAKTDRLAESLYLTLYHHCTLTSFPRLATTVTV